MTDGSDPDCVCFVCAGPLGEPEAIAVTQHAGESEDRITICLHQTCAPCLAVAILDGLGPVRIWRAKASSQDDRLRKHADVHLSCRETQILQRLVLGETNRQIARQLGIGEKWVKQVVSVLLWKLDAQSRTEAAVVAVRAGLIEFRPES
jgi:DNA-binding CsgD family transcriptional regulator